MKAISQITIGLVSGLLLLSLPQGAAAQAKKVAAAKETSVSKKAAAAKRTPVSKKSTVASGGAVSKQAATKKTRASADNSAAPAKKGGTKNSVAKSSGSAGPGAAKMAAAAKSTVAPKSSAAIPRKKSPPVRSSGKRTVAGCRNAYVVLAASSDGKHEGVWGPVGRVLRDKRRWTVVDQPPSAVTDKVSFRQYSLAKRSSVTAYVGHCGFGKTCNDLADAVQVAYPHLGKPVVGCGQTPTAFVSPTPASP